jgi:hypothetical protein
MKLRIKVKIYMIKFIKYQYKKKSIIIIYKNKVKVHLGVRKMLILHHLITKTVYNHYIAQTYQA